MITLADIAIGIVVGFISYEIMDSVFNICIILRKGKDESISS